MSEHEAPELCPLCCNEMDATDRAFKPCRCGYQICAWCWHQLMELASKDDAKGKCPACRTEYDEDSISFDAPPEEELTAQKSKKRDGKGVGAAAVGTNGAKGAIGAAGSAGTSRKHLQNVRVIQRNLVYVVGLSSRCCKEEVLRKSEFFGKYGDILKLQVSINKQGSSSYAGRDAENTGSAYVTFYEETDAMKCIQHIDGTPLDGRILRACFGTTKYCNSFLKYLPCNNPDCLYLHDIGEDNDSFTKEEMLAHYGTKHQSFQEATRAASTSGGGGASIERTSSLSSIPAPLTGGLRVPPPRPLIPTPPVGPPPPNALGVGVPVASAWPSLGSSNSPSKPAAAAPPAAPPAPSAPPPALTKANKSSIPAPRVPAPRATGVCPVRPAGAGGPGWGSTNSSLGVFGGPSSATAASTATSTTSPSSGSNSPTSQLKTKNGFTLPQPRKIAGVTVPAPKAAAPAAADATVPSAHGAPSPAGADAASAFPDALFTDAFNTSLDFDPGAILRKHVGASQQGSPVEQPRASRFGFALEAQSPTAQVAQAKDGESMFRALLPGANVRIATHEPLTTQPPNNATSIPAPRRGPPPGFGGAQK
jgi:CCR4-NOT transcription complex subunit 4